MKEKKPIKKRKWYLPVSGIFALGTLAGSLTLIRTFMEDNPEDAQVTYLNYPVLLQTAAALFALIAAFHILHLVASFHESRLLVCKYLFYIIFTACGSVFLLVDKDSVTLLPRACLIYLLAVFIGRVISLVMKRSKLNFFLAVITLIVLILGACAVVVSYTGDPGEKQAGTMLAIILLFFVVDIEGVASIVPIAFSSVRMDILKRIIKKTYAAEILSGIVLLIVAISFILPAFEYHITNFGDALWYCFAIVTTIGFGDITATSAVGRVLSVILGLYGIIVVSLITSIIVNFYGEMKKEDRDDTPPDAEQIPDDQAGTGQPAREKNGDGQRPREKNDDGQPPREKNGDGQRSLEQPGIQNAGRHNVEEKRKESGVSVEEVEL